MRQLGLRVDADTFRGTRDGIPALLSVLRKHDVTASFFFCLGPDNMGRHLLRLRHPSFLAKMWRSRAARLYGWDIVFRGLLWPGRIIAGKLATVIRRTAAEGHEVGLHAWDHFGWQKAALVPVAARFIREDLRRGVEAFREVLGRMPGCSAAPAWLGTDEALRLKVDYPFCYNSDCRGTSVFRPVVAGSGTLLQPQVPTTLPVYDEVIGRNGLTDGAYNRFLLGRLRPGRLNVLTVHAEVEGIACLGLFERFLTELRNAGFRAGPLGNSLGPESSIPAGVIRLQPVSGRQGMVAVQADGGLSGDRREVLKAPVP